MVWLIFIVIEEVDLNKHALEERETYWIRFLKPEYNATKDAPRNIGVSHSDEVKLAISKKRSKGVIYIYNEFQQLLAISPSLISIAVLLGNKSISISLKRAIREKALFRSSWYFSTVPFNEAKPLMEVPSLEYDNLIAQIKSQKHIKKAIFVFKDNQFVCKYNGIMSAEKALKISHDTIKKVVNKNISYKGYTFSYHRVLD